MSAATSLADRLLRIAVRRWPAALRAEQAREWAAEIEVLRRDPARSPLWRAIDQLRYAASLALSRPAEDPAGGPPAWRTVLPGIRYGVKPLALLLAVPFAGTVVLFLAIETLGRYGQMSRLAVIVAVSALAAGLGWRLGARLPLTVNPRLGGPATPVLLAAGTLGALALLVQAWPEPSVLVTCLYGLVGWTLVMVPVAAATVRLAGRGRRFIALAVGLAGGLGALQLVVAILGVVATGHPAPFGTTLLEPVTTFFGGMDNPPEWVWMVSGLGALPRTLLIGTAFAVPYAARAVRPRPA